MKKILLTLLFGIFLMGFVSPAIEKLPDPIEQGDCLDIPQTCADCTYNNITSILYPNGTRFLFSPEQNMTRSGTDYLFHTCDFSSLVGIHVVNGYGDLGGTATIWNYNYEVTKTGTDLETSDSILYLLLTAGSLFFFLLCLYGGMVLPFGNKRNDENRIISIQKLKYFKVGLLFLSYVFFVWLSNLLFTLANNFKILTPYVGFFKIIFLVFSSMAYPIFVFMLILMGAMAWKDLQLKKLLTRGIRPK